MTKRTLDDLKLLNKRVLMRADFNVPLSPEGKIEDDLRIKAAIPSIDKVLEDGGSLILMSHLGRPGGEVVPKLSLKPVAESLSKILSREVKFADDCIGADSLALSSSLAAGELLLLENLRFHKEETENDSEFAQALAAHGDIYVNDAFGTAHRKHASTYGVPEFMDTAVAGYLMESEVKYMSELVENPRIPMVVVLGGAKVSDKIPVIKNLSKLADAFLIGGGMAFTFLKALGHPVGKSLVDDNLVDTCKEILRELSKKGINYHLPTDCVAVSSVDSPELGDVCLIDELGDDKMGVDIGPMTVAEFDHVLEGAKTVIWNGPMGIFEVPYWSNGTVSIGRKLVELTKAGATTVVGGGDSASAMKQMNLSNDVSHISTGGGATLEILSGNPLPGLEMLEEKE
ncbi:MAG: phosphoglycerate kinase [Candidatus Marinimicrobia bacterium]|nr:phosphoglycerate kinase [Candidatus Neomarinimicrobiota bacterium]